MSFQDGWNFYDWLSLVLEMLNQLQEVVIGDVIILNYIFQDIFCGM